jgi:Flp pilus assembly protein TadB
MRRPSRAPRRYRTTTDPTPQAIILSTLLVLAVPVVQWAASNPLVAALSLTAGVGVAAAARRTLALRRCLASCGGVTVDLVGDLRICVTRRDAEGAC